MYRNEIAADRSDGPHCSDPRTDQSYPAPTVLQTTHMRSANILLRLPSEEELSFGVLENLESFGRNSARIDMKVWLVRWTW